jgi:hypothetical protein
MIDDQIRIRTLTQRVQKDGVIVPASLLKGLAELMNDADAVKRWRTGKYKELREMMDACLLAYGLSKALETDVWVVRGEQEDYDCVLLAVGDDGLQFVGIQLKELPPEHVNPRLTLEELLGGLAAKPSTDTTLVIRLNRTGYIPDEVLSAVQLPYREVWYLWATSPDGLGWCIYGDVMQQPRRYEFAYPL